MTDPMHIYNYLPLSIQNIAVSLYGYYIRKRRYGGNFRKYVAKLERDQWLTVEELAQIQRQRLRSIVAHAYKNVPYYRNLFDKIGLSPEDIKDVENLKEIPILEKKTLREHTNEFIAKSISRRKLMPYTTGGTTGTPLTIYVTKDAIQYNFATAEARYKHWAGVKSGDRLATFLGRVIVPASVKKPPFWRWNTSFNQLLFSSFHMSEENLKYYVEELRRFRPEVIQGYVSTVHTLASYILNHDKEIPPPKAVLVSSETLFDWQRKDIEKAFGSKVFNGYSAAEYTAFISECEEGGLHISPEYGVVEFEKKGNKYELITTGLFNYAMPLIRYRIGDVVIPSPSGERCPCGRELPLVNSIEGRTDDMIVTPEGRYISPASLSLVFQSARNIKEAQIIQFSFHKVAVRLVKKEAFDRSDHDFIIRELRSRLGNNISISIEFVKEIERTKAGKFRFIISDISKINQSKEVG